MFLRLPTVRAKLTALVATTLVMMLGRVAYRLRRPRRNGATHLVMTAPTEISIDTPVRRPRAEVVLARRRRASGPGSAFASAGELEEEQQEEEALEEGPFYVQRMEAAQ